MFEWRRRTVEYCTWSWWCWVNNTIMTLQWQQNYPFHNVLHSNWKITSRHTPRSDACPSTNQSMPWRWRVKNIVDNVSLAFGGFDFYSGSPGNRFMLEQLLGSWTATKLSVLSRALILCTHTSPVNYRKCNSCTHARIEAVTHPQVY